MRSITDSHLELDVDLVHVDVAELQGLVPVLRREVPPVHGRLHLRRVVAGDEPPAVVHLVLALHELAARVDVPAREVEGRDGRAGLAVQRLRRCIHSFIPQTNKHKHKQY